MSCLKFHFGCDYAHLMRCENINDKYNECSYCKMVAHYTVLLCRPWSNKIRNMPDFSCLKKKLWKIMKNCFTSLITKITIGFNFEADIHIQIELSYFRKCPLLWKIGFLSHTRKVKAKYPFPDQM